MDKGGGGNENGALALDKLHLGHCNVCGIDGEKGRFKIAKERKWLENPGATRFPVQMREETHRVKAIISTASAPGRSCTLSIFLI